MINNYYAFVHITDNKIDRELILISAPNDESALKELSENMAANYPNK